MGTKEKFIAIIIARFASRSAAHAVILWTSVAYSEREDRFGILASCGYEFSAATCYVIDVISNFRIRGV